ncbi:MAG: AAA family ATPase [Aeromonas sobria]|uniref:AAA family ATPase n=1 Tax=Aeromonas sobria TaxID=646 RepID=UPI003F2C17FD
MSQSKLFINRFAVYANGKFVYDQKFHLGINIIRGENGTGKSTVMDLLNYGLGSETAEWTDEQDKCDWVITQVSVNDHPITLKRNITPTGQERVQFFDGDMDKALTSVEGWQKYPMRRNSDTHSYSQHMFELLNMPRHKTDDDKNLTMHQILRLIYVDQLSATTKLLKEDPKYDNITTRRAIGEYLLGIDALEAFNLRQDLIKENKTFEKVNAELNAIYKMFGHDEILINEQSLNSSIEEIKTSITSLESEKNIIKIATTEDVSLEVTQRIKELVASINKHADMLSALETEKRELQTELKETSIFLRSLEERKEALSESVLAYSALGDVSFEYCPSCLESIEVKNIDECCLCKAPHKHGNKDFAYSKLLNELNFQIKESKHIINTFDDDVKKIDISLPKIRQLLLAKKTELKEINTSSDEKEAKLCNIASKIGFCRSQILALEEKRTPAARVDLLKAQKTRAIQQLSELQTKLDEVSALQENRYLSVYNSIELKAKELLELDGGYEESFKSPEEVTLDFAKDKMYVNGRSKFSASSMVVMKNSIRFSIFSHAVDDIYSRLPNLLLMDNIEDKGMQKERSQNFQEQIVKVSKSIKSSFQLIYTTSMIADELEGSDLCVGPFYAKGTHTLEF